MRIWIDGELDRSIDRIELRNLFCDILQEKKEQRWVMVNTGVKGLLFFRYLSDEAKEERKLKRMSPGMLLLADTIFHTYTSTNMS